VLLSAEHTTCVYGMARSKHLRRVSSWCVHAAFIINRSAVAVTSSELVILTLYPVILIHVVFVILAGAADQLFFNRD